MDPCSIDQIFEGMDIAVIVMGASIASVALMLGGAAGVTKLTERKYLLDRVYKKNLLEKKPTYWTAIKSYLPFSKSYIRTARSDEVSEDEKK